MAECEGTQADLASGTHLLTLAQGLLMACRSFPGQCQPLPLPGVRPVEPEGCEVLLPFRGAFSLMTLLNVFSSPGDSFLGRHPITGRLC